MSIWFIFEFWNHEISKHKEVLNGHNALIKSLQIATIDGLECCTNGIIVCCPVLCLRGKLVWNHNFFTKSQTVSSREIPMIFFSFKLTHTRVIHLYMQEILFHWNYIKWCSCRNNISYENIFLDMSTMHWKCNRKGMNQKIYIV